jgi:ribose transport system permease protein
MEQINKSLARFRRTPAFTGFILFMAALVLNAIMQGLSSGNFAAFFMPKSFGTLFMTNTPFILVAMAQSLLLISGVLDISIGIQLALVNVICIMVPQQWGMPVPVGWIFGILAAIAASILCGIGCSVLRLPSMLVGYSLIFIIQGVNVLIMNIPQGKVPKVFYKAYDSLLLGVIPVSALVIVFVFLLWVFVKRSRFGKHLYAVGGSPRNAFAAGISPVAVQMKAFILKGFIVGIAGICLTLMTASGNPLQGEDLGLRSLSACILGGLGFGGWGSMSCAAFGAGFFTLIQNAVYYFFTYLRKLIPGFSVTSYWNTMVSDVILLLGLLMTIVTAREQRNTLRQGFINQFKRGEKHVA